MLPSEGHPFLGSRPSFGPRHAQWGSRLDSELASTCCCARKAVVSPAVWGVALCWTYTKFHPKTSVAQGSILSRRNLMWRWRLRVPPSTTSSLPLPWCTQYHDWRGTVIAPGFNACIYQSLPLTVAHRARPSLWNSVKRDSSQKTRCLQCRGPAFRALSIPHTRRHCLWSKVYLGHLVGHAER